MQRPLWQGSKSYQINPCSGLPTTPKPCTTCRYMSSCPSFSPTPVQSLHRLGIAHKAWVLPSEMLHMERAYTLASGRATGSDKKNHLRSF